MIIPEYKIAYIKIPRTGSTSIRRYLRKLDKYNNVINLNQLHGVKRDPRCYRRGSGWALGAHVCAQDIKWYLGDDEYERYFTFTFVRNPFARLVSNYSWQKGKGLNIATFRKFVDTLVDSPLSLPKQARLHAIPQTHWITSESGERIVDFVGRLENQAADFRSVLKKLGLPPGKVSTVNQTSHSHYSNYYDDNTVSLVREYYAADLEAFGYSFEDRRDPNFQEPVLRFRTPKARLLKGVSRLRRLLISK